MISLDLMKTSEVRKAGDRPNSQIKPDILKKPVCPPPFAWTLTTKGWSFKLFCFHSLAPLSCCEK